MKKTLSIMCVSTILAVGGCANAPTSPPALTGEITGEISVTCYDTATYKQFLDEAVTLFEQKYPGTKVSIDAVSAMPEVKTREEGGRVVRMMIGEKDSAGINDYINKINTELMSNSGADLIAMDVVPYYSYAKNGQILDLSQYIDTDLDLSSYHNNLLQASKINSGLYVLPIGYSFNYFVYDSSLIDDSNFTKQAYDIDGLISLGLDQLQGREISIFGLTDGYSRGSLFFELMSHNTEFVDFETKTANFTTGSFEELLEYIKSLSEQGVIKHEVSGANKAPSMTDMEKSMQQKVMFKLKDSNMLMQEFHKNPNVRIMSSTAVGDATNDKIAGIAQNSSGKIPFNYTQAYGINSNSKNKETAWAFLKFLVDEQMQLSTNLRGLPINTTVAKKRAEMAVTGELYAQGRGGDVQMNAELENIVAQYLDAVDGYTQQIKYLTISDSKVLDIIEAEVKIYFNGTKSAAETAAVLQNKVGLYLKELT